jgi:tetratricopeptide (TPR) repeat protein
MRRRTKGAASAPPIDAVAHLLRHLHDPCALHANPIAARYFSSEAGARSRESDADGLARVRALVAGAVDRVFASAWGTAATEHALRQRAIVERCDLLGEPHSAVATSLGLSRRQFYRERHDARERLAEYFARASHPRCTQSLPDAFELGLAFAESLCRLGRRAAAIASIKELRENSAGAAERIRANLALASAYSDAGKLAAADGALRQARIIFASQSSAIDGGRLLCLEIETVAARMLWLSGKPAEMKATQERILTQLRQRVPLQSERAFELEALSWMRLGMLSRDVGEADKSLRYLQRAAVVLEALPKPSASLRAELFANLGLTQMVLPNGMPAAAESMRAYLAVSREHNLLCDVADALANLATLYLQSGDVRTARMFGRTGLDLAQRVSSRQQRAEIAVIAALAEAEGGNFRLAFELIERARVDIVQHSPGWALTGLAEAQALVYAGAFDAAWRSAREAAASMSAMGMTRYCGAALRIAAEAAEGSNRRGEAVRTIREAIALLETRGHAASLSRAYECQARLTGKRGDAHRARELRESLRPSLASR